MHISSKISQNAHYLARMADQDKDFPSPAYLREMILKHLNFPVIFKKRLNSWKQVPWSLDEMIAKYGSLSLTYRLVPKQYDGVAWEGKAEYIEATLSMFDDWIKNRANDAANPFSQYSSKEYWAYSSYNYMSHIFSEDSDILKAVNWKMFGLNEEIGNESAFWIGSEGAYTPCHYDTYGCNLVAQIYGRKKWILFPPDDTSFLYPTRIPYEESSVFSSVNILQPDTSTHPKFQQSHPHIVTLEPGDVLFVPKHWWHFVMCLNTSASINTWIKLESDESSRLEESVTKAVVTGLISAFEPIGESWLNPNEELLSSEETMEYIVTLLKRQDGNAKLDAPKSLIPNIFHHEDIIKVNLSERFHGESPPAQSQSCLTVHDILNCFVHPEVVTLMCTKLKQLKRA